MDKPKLILSDKFNADPVRGPVLQKIIWSEDGTYIKEISFERNSIIKFKGLQAIMITPHEVYGYNDMSNDLPAGIYNLGRSKWFKSMSDQHLEKCSHYKLFFYDEIIDVICEDVIIKKSVKNWESYSR